MEKLIKIILAILFFMCLIDFPYGFYQFVRFTALVGFAILAFKAFEKENQTEMIIYIVLGWPAAQIAHLVFADTQANAEITKRAIFLANALIK